MTVPFTTKSLEVSSGGEELDSVSSEFVSVSVVEVVEVG
jgi:hypothetical protein